MRPTPVQPALCPTEGRQLGACRFRTRLAHVPNRGHTAPRPRVRALCAAFPSRSPLLPARMRSLRAASVFPTSPPQRARGRGREHYGSATRVNRQEGGPIRKRTGGKPGTPRPRKPRPGSRFSPRPPFLPPQTNATHRTNDRGKRKATTTGRRTHQLSRSSTVPRIRPMSRSPVQRRTRQRGTLDTRVPLQGSADPCSGSSDVRSA